MNIYTDKESYKYNLNILKQIAKIINDNTDMLNRLSISLDIANIKDIQYHYKDIRGKYYRVILDNICKSFGVDYHKISRWDNNNGLVFNMADSRYKPIGDMLFNLYRLMITNFTNSILDYLSINGNVANIINENDIINMFTYDTKNDKQKEVTTLLKQIIEPLNKLNKYGVKNTLFSNTQNIFINNLLNGEIIGINKDSIYKL